MYEVKMQMQLIPPSFLLFKRWLESLFTLCRADPEACLIHNSKLTGSFLGGKFCDEARRSLPEMSSVLRARAGVNIRLEPHPLCPVTGPLVVSCCGNTQNASGLSELKLCF